MPKTCVAPMTAMAVAAAYLSAATAMVVAPPDHLLHWLEQQGGRSSVRVATDQITGLRGLTAASDAGVGDVLLSVPLSVCLADCGSGGGLFDEALAWTSTLRGEAPAWTSSLPSKVQLALTVLAQQGAAQWFPFLSSWPSSLPELPSNLDLATLRDAYNAADPEDLAAATVMSLARLQDDYLAAAELAPGGDGIGSFDRFRGAVQLVGSRCLRVNAGQHGSRLLIVPVLDMANHDFDPSAYYAYTEADGLVAMELRARRPLTAGDAVTICYGDYPSGRFALAYGFLPAENPYDSLLVSLPQLLEAAATAADRASAVSPMILGTWSMSASELAERVAAVAAAGLQVQQLALHPAAPSEPAMFALRAALSSDGGAALARRLEGAAMDLWDDDDDEDDLDGVLDSGEGGEELDELIAVCARVVAAACPHLASIYERDADLGDAGKRAPPVELLDAFRRSRVELLRSLQRSMEEVAAETCRGRRASEVERRQRVSRLS